VRLTFRKIRNDLDLSIVSLSTIHREFAALVAFPHYDHFGTILRPQLRKVPVTDQNEVKEIVSTYHVNEPQAIAISSSLQTEGFVLIQGYENQLARDHSF
jgi:senataxin